MPGKKKTTASKHGGSRGGPNARGKKATPAKGGGRSRRERRQALAELKNLQALAEMVGAGERSRGLVASLRSPGDEVELPGWIDAEVSAAEDQATPGRLPLVLFRIEDKPVGDALVVMRLSQMARHFNISVNQVDGSDGPAAEEGV